MPQSLESCLKSNSGKRVILLGKIEGFTKEEIVDFLEGYSIALCDKIDDDVVALIESHRLSHVDEVVSCDAYVRDIPIYKLDDLTRLMSTIVIDKSILMKLKLTNDQKQIYNLIVNEYIDDNLFLDIAQMYHWDEDITSDNDNDRGVIIATLKRFLDYKPNESDLIYSPQSLNRLVHQTRNAKLLKLLLSYPNFDFLQKGKQRITLYESIACSRYINQEIIDILMRLRSKEIPFFLAANPSTPPPILKSFFNNHKDHDIQEALASNPSIDNALFAELASKKGVILELLMTHQPITKLRFGVIESLQIDPKTYKFLGQNPKVDGEIITRLIKRDNHELSMELASNPNIPASQIAVLYKRSLDYHLPISGNPATPAIMLEKLFKTHQKDMNLLIKLAGNPITPEHILIELHERGLFVIDEVLAGNPSVPLTILNQLKIDSRHRNALTNNPTFTKSITQSLGL